MIVRIWHGWTRPENADAYEQLLDGTIVPGIMARGIEGLQSVEILRGQEVSGGMVEFVTVMRFDDLAAVEAFAGSDTSVSVIPREAQRLLSRYDAHSKHYGPVGHHGRET